MTPETLAKLTAIAGEPYQRYNHRLKSHAYCWIVDFKTYKLMTAIEGPKTTYQIDFDLMTVWYH